MGGSGNKPPNDPRIDQKGSGLILRVKVIKGRNLAAKDKSGTSDPFLVITLGDTKEATSVERKTLSPEWNQTFELPVVSGDSALLEGVCWDKDRFRNDYMGEFDVMLEDIFTSVSTTSPDPKWIKLEGRRTSRKKKKNSNVSGEVLLAFSLHDSTNPSATAQQVISKFYGMVVDTTEDEDEDGLLTNTSSLDLEDSSDLDDDEHGETDDGAMTPGGGSADESTKMRRRRRIRKLRRKSKMKAYEFSGLSDVSGVLYLEISRITDLPPETNMTRTTFDMDPFVVTSLGKKTYRTRVVRHNLNPVYDEKMVFSVQKHEQNYSLNFAVVDRDNFSNNDFVGTATLALEQIRAAAPEADAETGLYKLPDPDNVTDGENRRRRWRVPLSRAASSTSISRLSRDNSTSNLSKLGSALNVVRTASPKPGVRRQDSDLGAHELRPPPTSNPSYVSTNTASGENTAVGDDVGLNAYEVPLTLKNKQRWEAKHNPVLFLKAKYLPYKALRQQFWRLMLRQYDADDSGNLSKVELVTMLDTLGSTLHDSTVDGFFDRWKDTNGGEEYLTIDQAVICLEEQLLKTPETQTHSLASHLRMKASGLVGHRGPADGNADADTLTQTNAKGQKAMDVPTLNIKHHGAAGERGETLSVDDLAQSESLDDHEFDNLMDEGGRNDKEEHVIEIQECPICHQPRLQRGRRTTDADIITHIATCASSDWRAVNNLVMAGFVTSSQAQRKWYSKVISKVSYGGYRLGANSANILVQDRITGMINEERMSVYVRLGIRLLYKGLKSRDMEKKKVRKLLRSLSVKQGRKYDDPASASQIPGFIAFHQLDMGEVLLPMESFKNFNEFFYRALKPDARPCSAPDNNHIIVSPADCRTVVFNRLDDAQRIWVKGREFSVERLLGNAYPEDAKIYKNGAMGIFRLAPQDYHRFHIPVDGVLGEPKLLEGEYYTVNPMAIRSALDVYGENVRVCVPIDSVAHGRVMVICVGAMMVGSTVITRKQGETVKRAEELGYFKFGGSTLLVLFPPGAMRFDDDLIDNSNEALETLVRVGMSVGRSPHVEQHTPDMKKSDPTAEEMQDAQRRIGGSLGPDGPSHKPSGMDMALKM